FCFTGSAPDSVPHSFPTRRSSDLSAALGTDQTYVESLIFHGELRRVDPEQIQHRRVEVVDAHRMLDGGVAEIVGGAVCEPSLDRSEEHTSELQSRFDLVCRLLLEK